MTERAQAPKPGRIVLTIGPADAGKRLDVLLQSQPRIGSRTKAQALISAGAVTVDGKPRPKSHAVEQSERVIVTLEPAAAPEPEDPSAPHEVVYEDDHLMVVDKPAGVVVHPAPGHRSGTLVEALQGRAAGGTDPWRPGIVHRLDRDTSGLLIVAKDDATHRALQD